MQKFDGSSVICYTSMYISYCIRCFPHFLKGSVTLYDCTVIHRDLPIIIFLSVVSNLFYLLLSLALQPSALWLWPPRSRGFVITHIDAPQSVGLLWTSDHFVTEIST
jgi:hypothetical protein